MSIKDDVRQLRDWAADLLRQAVEQFGDMDEPDGARMRAFRSWVLSAEGIWGFVQELGQGGESAPNPELLQLVPVRSRSVLRRAFNQLEKCSRANVPPVASTIIITELRALIEVLDELLPESPSESGGLPPVKGDDRLVRLRVCGLRCLEDVTIELDGLVILIGENGAGKSSVVEALEILSQLTRDDLNEFLSRRHGGFQRLLRQGAQSLCFELEVRGSDGPMLYTLSLTHDAQDGLGIEHESILFEESGDSESPVDWSVARSAITRVFDKVNYIDVWGGRVGVGDIGPRATALELSFVSHAARMADVLERMSIHPSFFILSGWVGEALGLRSRAREANLLRPTRRLERFADNLSNAYHTLKNARPRDHWQETLAQVRLGLGMDVEDILLNADPSGGQIALALKYRSLRESVPLWGLSDGMMSYLAFVALARLSSDRSILVFDEPEVHLHPGLLIRVLGLFETLSETTPVLLTTHSDRLLDGLSDPASSVVLMELGPGLTTRLMRPDREGLSAWLEEYNGLGALRADGLERSVMRVQARHDRSGHVESQDESGGAP